MFTTRNNNAPKTHSMKTLSFFYLFLCCTVQAQAARLFVEAESFSDKGGWVVDQQFMDQMGSPYLMAHGMGKPVTDATTRVRFPAKGRYYVFVRTFNWTSPWDDREGPGKFLLSVGNVRIDTVLGNRGNRWMWQPAGTVAVSRTDQSLTLHDLTGFNGRCDAIYFTTDKNDIPPSDPETLALFRGKRQKLPEPHVRDGYDLVVAGGGIAGICAAVSAARLGCKVALINDRPVLGGNNSSEIRVHLGGRIETGPYKELGNLLKEFGPVKGGNAQPAAYYEDDKKEEIVHGEENISLFPNYRIVQVTATDGIIRSVTAVHIETGEKAVFQAPLFSDCTGDGTVGYLAGADYRMGRESREEFGETTAPETADSMTMGASVQWYSEEREKPSEFPVFEYGPAFHAGNCEPVTFGEWTWETGMNYDQIEEFERIRDYGLLVIYANWSYLKNKSDHAERYKNRELAWVAYIAGKRESRRLLGDYILKEDDLRKYVNHEDGTAATSWTIDLHYPDPQNTRNFPGNEFKSIARHIPIHPYPIPYRCLYSRNIRNLFMAGRNISVTHVALGTVRVMRTTGMMGEVVGMAAWLCKKYETLPREIYRSHLSELKTLMTKGTGRKGLPNNQRYNEGGTLRDKPVIP